MTEYNPSFAKLGPRIPIVGRTATIKLYRDQLKTLLAYCVAGLGGLGNEAQRNAKTDLTLLAAGTFVDTLQLVTESFEV